MSMYEPDSVGNPFHKGDRVRYSARGLRQMPRHRRELVGVVAHEPQRRPRARHTVGVLWPGSKTVFYYAIDFIERVPDGHD